MRIVAQRVTRGSVRVDDRVVGEIDHGLVLLIGCGPEDDEDELNFWADKCVNLRVFRDAEGRMNRSVLDVGGAILAISQFTLYGNVRKGRRPSYIGAAPPEQAEPLYNRFVDRLRAHHLQVETGVFGAMMEVEIHNDGPVTLILER